MLEVDRRERWTIGGAVLEFDRLRRDDRVDPLGPAQIVELRQTAGAVKDKIVLRKALGVGTPLIATSALLAAESNLARPRGRSALS